MDIFTHLTWWYLLKKIFSNKKNRFILIIFLFSAIFPDLDIIWSWNNIALHRILTHNLTLAPIFSLIISYIFYNLAKRNKQISFIKIYFIVLSWILLHIFLDYIAVWGIPLFYPISNKYYSLNLYTYVFDLFLFLIFTAIIIFIILEHKTKFRFTKFKALFLTFLFYLIISIRFLEWYYAWKISSLENHTTVPFIITGSDFLYINRYKIIEKKDNYFYIEYVDIFSKEILLKTKVKISDKQDSCSQMHNWFLFEEWNLIWDIRYTDKLTDSNSCFYWTKF